MGPAGADAREAAAERAPEPLLRRAATAAIHSARVLGYLPVVAVSLILLPAQTVSATAAYYAIRFSSPAYRRAVQRALAAAASRRPRLVRAQRAAYDPKRQYLLAAHPHGILNYGWWNLISRYGLIPLLHPPFSHMWHTRFSHISRINPFFLFPSSTPFLPYVAHPFLPYIKN